MANGYDRFMVTLDAAVNIKTKRLKRAGKEVRWAWFHGVLPIAAKADMRGAFRVGDQAATEQDVADVADCTRGEARKALEVARALGMLEQDASGVEWVHDFEEYNPEPKKDSTSAKRSADYRARMRERLATVRDVTHSSRRDGRDDHGTVTPPEVEEEVEGTEEEETRARIQAGIDAGALHPKLLDVLDVFAAVKATHPAFQVEELAIDSACKAKPNGDHVAAAHTVAAWMHAGTARRLIASSLLAGALDQQREADAKVQAAGEMPARRTSPAVGSRRLTHADELAQLERAAQEQLAREAAERSAAA